MPGPGVISYNQAALPRAEGPSGPNPVNGIPKGRKAVLPFPKKILYYALMLLLTLLAVEGMARLAYYAAYGQGYGGGADAAGDVAPLPALDAANAFKPRVTMRHPFYAYGHRPAFDDMNETPPRQRRADTIVVGLLGGSVAEDVEPYLQDALSRWFAANHPPRQPIVRRLAIGTAKQPQQTIIVAHTLLLGGEFDLLVNLDGFNEMTLSAQNFGGGVFPFYPTAWNKQVGLTTGEILLAGRIGALRREQERLMALAETSPLRRSAIFGLLNRWRRERATARIIQLNQDLAAAEVDYSLEKHGPRNWLTQEAEMLPAAARFWYRGSLALARLAQLAGADYYHFLHPNQYFPDSKPLSPQELESAYSHRWFPKLLVESGYPQLRQFNRDLPEAGINYFDLTAIFADHPETLYIDDCCHLNHRGNELLAAAMVQRMEPSLRRLGVASPDPPVSALAAARRPAAPAKSNLADHPGFQVSLAHDGKQLRYVLAGCAPEYAELPFFLHLTPRDPAALPPLRREHGFNSMSFSFAEAGGRPGPGECAAQYPLPAYPLAALRTGQYVPVTGAPLWSVELIVPIDSDQLRADYAALSTMQPVVRDFFDLYALDNRLLYLRESCAAADTAAAFFLHILPEEITDLPADRQDAGFAHSGFDFDRQGGRFDGKCLATISLPDYPIAAIRTGQHIPGQGDLWSVELIAAPNLDQLRADYAALSAANPDARNYFDLYRRDNRLFYLRETCTAADTAAAFFLHIVPADVTDLPAERQAAGFAHRDFAFARRGGRFDGKCLAVVPLPNYPGGIKEMRTGQFVPGQGDLWSAAIVAP